MISPNHDARPENCPIDHLVLHYTGMQSRAASLARLCDPAAKVSSHYVVAEDGTIDTLVVERYRAWHAGVSYWRGLRTLNDRSIGIEIVNPGHEWGYARFPEAQIAAVEGLCRAILGRHPIPPCNVVGHSDIAPDRKRDPGELFPWRRLAGTGIGLWIDDIAEPGERNADPGADLAAIGYDPALDAALVIAAFQRRFRPSRCDGILDRETTGRIAAVRLRFSACAISI